MDSAAEKWKTELQKSIDLLQQRKAELQAIYADPPGPSMEEQDKQRGEIIIKMNEIQSKKLTLKTILSHIKASAVVIPEVTPETAAALNTAMEELNQEIEREQQFNKILQAATDILNAADQVISEAQKI